MTRKLKIEERGDPFRKVFPGIRLKGQWLAEAGFPIGQHVNLTLISPGVMELRVERTAPVLPMPPGLAAIKPHVSQNAMRRHAQRRGRELLESAAAPVRP